MADKLTKITIGFVTQTFDDNGKCTHQEFIAGDQVDYEDMVGNVIDEPDNEQYQSYEMVQPDAKIVVTVEGGLINGMSFTPGLNDLTFVVKDYDTDGFDEDDLQEDGDGEKYIRSEYSSGG